MASHAKSSLLCGRKALLHEPDVLTLTLTAPESYGIDAGQPLILHGVQVGTVIDRKLTSKGVTFTVAIEPQHRELVKAIANLSSTAVST